MSMRKGKREAEDAAEQGDAKQVKTYVPRDYTPACAHAAHVRACTTACAHVRAPQRARTCVHRSVRAPMRRSHAFVGARLHMQRGQACAYACTHMLCSISGPRSGVFSFLADKVESSVLRNGKVGTRRAKDGNDGGSFGLDMHSVSVDVHDARDLAASLESAPCTGR